MQRCSFNFNTDFCVWTDTFSFYVFGFCVYAYMNVGPENILKNRSVGAIHLVLETDSLSSLELVLSLAGWSVRGIWDLPVSFFPLLGLLYSAQVFFFNVGSGI